MLAPADSLSQAQPEGGQRKGAQLEGGQLETVTVSAPPFRGCHGTTTGSLSYLSTEQLRAGMRNLGNSHYAAMLLVNAPSFGNQPARYYYPGEPRNFYLGLPTGSSVRQIRLTNMWCPPIFWLSTF